VLLGLKPYYIVCFRKLDVLEKTASEISSCTGNQVCMYVSMYSKYIYKPLNLAKFLVPQHEVIMVL